jgi:DNA-3-methyladenine glycosylase II
MDASTVRESEATVSFALPAVPPVHLEATVRALQRRPANRIDLWDRGRYLRVLPTAEGLRLIAVENRGTIAAPALHGHVFGGPVSPATQEQIGTTVQRLLGLGVDLARFYALAEQDPRLQAATVALRGLKPPRFATLFETIANVIPFQQVSIAAGVAVVARLVERFGQRLDLGTRTYVAFPGPDQVARAAVEDLQRLGLSRAKARTLHTLAVQVCAGALSEERLEALPSTEAMATLTALPGIGPWSAGLILLRGLRRMEIFPEGDVGAAKNLGRLLGLEGPTRVADIRPVVVRMGHVKGYLYFYALGWRLLGEGLITPAPPHV